MQVSLRSSCSSIALHSQTYPEVVFCSMHCWLSVGQAWLLSVQGLPGREKKDLHNESDHEQTGTKTHHT